MSQSNQELTVIPVPPYRTLETDRLIIRFFDPSRASDYADILSVYRDPPILAKFGDKAPVGPADMDSRVEGGALLPSMIPNSTLPPPKFMFQLVYLKPSTSGFPTDGHSVPADKDSSTTPLKVIGHVSVWRKTGVDVPQLGYAIKCDYYRQGYATEAVREMLRFYSEELGLQKLQAKARADNLASVGVMIKAGGRKLAEIDEQRKNEESWEQDQPTEFAMYEWVFDQAGTS